MAPTDTTRRGPWTSLVRAVGRVPVNIRTKLLVAFGAVALVLVVTAVLGLRVLGQSNGRVSSLGTLQLRAATYQGLQTQAHQVRQLLGLRVADDPSVRLYTSSTTAAGQFGRGWLLVDSAIAAAVSPLAQATNESRFGFAPPPQDAALLARVRLDHERLSAALDRITAVDQLGAPSTQSARSLAAAIDADNDLSAATDQLASTTRNETEAVVARNRAAYSTSRDLFVAVAVGSVLLALLLGLVLSLSVIQPLRRTQERLAQIAAGDFSRHLDVVNRDELGSLATNLNRMNDELRRLYDELASASRHKSEFLATMSHELRTPLNAVIGFSELLQLQIAGPLTPQQAAYVDDVLESGQHLLSLINDVLDLSKVEAGRMELDVAEVSLREVLESGVTMHSARAARDGVALALDLDPEDIRVRADARKLRQVVVNLISNAVKFTPAGGRVGVTVRVLEGSIEVAVADTGPGISEQDQALIFEPFRQAGPGHEGTGLGLPLSRKLIELHGGRLWAETATGDGSTFRFTLPREPVG